MSENVGMSACCLSGAVHEGKPSGRVDTIAGLKTYIAEPKNGKTTKSLIFICDSTPNFPTLSLPQHGLAKVYFR